MLYVIAISICNMACQNNYKYFNQIILVTKTLETPFNLLKFHNHHDILQAKTTIVKMP